MAMQQQQVTRQPVLPSVVNWLTSKWLVSAIFYMSCTCHEHSYNKDACV